MSWIRAKPGLLIKDTLWVASGQSLRVGLQVVYFVLVARALGVREFGSYVAVLAMIALVAPFASLGSGNLLVKHVVRDPTTFPVQWGRALTVTVVSGTALLWIASLLGHVWLPASIPLALVLAIGVADLLFVRLVDISAMAYQAHQRLSRTALLQVLVYPIRLVGAGILVLCVAAPTALALGVVYAVSAAVSGTLALALTWRELGRPAVLTRAWSSELREGAFFATGLSAQSINNDLDKTMLARLSTLEATGLYGAAYRLVDMAFLPVTSVLVASYSRFFQHGARGLEAAAHYSRRFVGLGAVYGILVGAGLYLTAPALPLLLGAEYLQASEAVRWLALLPLIKAVHYFGANALTGAGYQGTRTLIMLCVILTNVLLNLWLIPLYSWRGAAAATIISDALLATVIWAAIWQLVRHNRRLGVGTPSVVKAG